MHFAVCQWLEWGCHTHCWALSRSERTRSREGDGNSGQAVPYEVQWNHLGSLVSLELESLRTRRRCRKGRRVGPREHRKTEEMLNHIRHIILHLQFAFAICMQTEGEGGVGGCPLEALGDQECISLWGHATLISKPSGLSGDAFC